jgi:DAK2 domain fusion protein YloV
VSDRDRLLELARAGLASLEASRRRIDDLNVYPVPDGDTGTNLTFTARAIVEALVGTSSEDRSSLAHEVTRAALLGARGNSGVILSQIVRGAADVLATAETVDRATLARVLRSASDAAYRAIREPVEGTMLSAIRALAEAAEQQPADVWPTLVQAGDEAVVRTREQLDVLREAGVVDAGAAGLVEIVRGVASAIAGEEIPPPPLDEERIGIDAIHQELSRYRYCTSFVIEGDELDAESLEAELARLGDSLLVVGDPSALKIHVHTDEPGAALSLGTAIGVIERVEIANMHEQTQARTERLRSSADDPSAGVVAVVAGEGNAELFASLGAAEIVKGGQTMNPAAAELVAAVENVRGKEVVVLPNNSNIVLTAEQAARLASKPVVVVPTRTMQAGLAAMLAFDPERDAAANAAQMGEALGSIATGEVAIASRDAQLNGVAVREGEFLGLVEERAVAGGGDFDEVAAAVTERLLAEPRGVLTMLTGADEPSLDALLALLAERYPDLEVDVQAGGQPHYPLLLSAE